MSCQLCQIERIQAKDAWFFDLLQGGIRIIRINRKRLIKATRVVLGYLLAGRKHTKCETIQAATIGRGDFVRVRSKHEIDDTLDYFGRYRGCSFSREMYLHCNKTYRVLKKVDYFYDETRKKLCRAKNLVILENVICSGVQRPYSVRCDRSCFFFFHVDWLERLDANAHMTFPG